MLFLRMKNFFTSHNENWHCCRRAQKFSENYVNVFLNLGKFAFVGISIQSMPCWKQESLKVYSALFLRLLSHSMKGILFNKMACEPPKQKAWVMDFERVFPPLDYKWFWTRLWINIFISSTFEQYKTRWEDSSCCGIILSFHVNPSNHLFRLIFFHGRICIKPEYEKTATSKGEKSSSVNFNRRNWACRV